MKTHPYYGKIELTFQNGKVMRWGIFQGEKENKKDIEEQKQNLINIYESIKVALKTYAQTGEAAFIELKKLNTIINIQHLYMVKLEGPVFTDMNKLPEIQ